MKNWNVPITKEIDFENSWWGLVTIRIFGILIYRKHINLYANEKIERSKQ